MKIKEVRPNIYLLNFNNQYDLAMSFLRYQEYYESASSKFRNKPFTIFSFMRWYAKTYGDGAFTYTLDWAGFNIPGEIIKDVVKAGIPDENEYDYFMSEIYNKLYKKSNKFYLIGTYGKDNGPILEHEIAHGFFYTNPEYKKQMTKLVSELPAKLRKNIFSSLKAAGYTKEVHIDECQAYMATGYNHPDITKKDIKPFEDLFNNYFNK